MSSLGAEVCSIHTLLLKQSNNMIIRKIQNLFIVQQKHSQQIVFSHKNINECYEYIFKTVNYA